MPFLHWETDRRRDKSAELIRKIRKKQLSSMIDVIETARKRVNSTINCTECGYATYGDAKTSPLNRITTVNVRQIDGEQPRELIEERQVPQQPTKTKIKERDVNGVGSTTKCTKCGNVTDKRNEMRLFGGLKRKVTDIRQNKKAQVEEALKNEMEQKRKSLGQLLLCAAALAEAMDYVTDERLMEKYLEADPPLHPRRTLDQFYYWTLKDTRTRDRDQVVYRSTAPTHEMMHNKCVKPGCQSCTEIIKKRPRVVMVDQLWMFILDNSKYNH
jgi:predicted nucleic-acid-binding Zn-ribbon protein